MAVAVIVEAHEARAPSFAECVTQSEEGGRASRLPLSSTLAITPTGDGE